MTPEQEQELLAEMRALKEQVLETSERLARMERRTGRLLLVLDGEAVVPKVFNPWTQHGRVVDIAASVHENAVRAHESASDSTPAQEQLLRQMLEELRALRLLVEHTTQGGSTVTVRVVE